MPAAATGSNGATRSSDATTATQSAPAISALVPRNVTPPESPVSVGRNVRIETGRRRASVPISVAHVSADAAANAPAKAALNGALALRAATAHSVATPPFARTCHAVRGAGSCVPSQRALLLASHAREQRGRQEERQQNPRAAPSSGADDDRTDHKRGDRAVERERARAIRRQRDGGREYRTDCEPYHLLVA